MNIDDIVSKYLELGYPLAYAESTAAHDIILSKIFRSHYRKNITIKGGVLMHSISNSIRRATKDIDLDFIKYSINNDSIIKFVNELNVLDDGVKLLIDKDIEELNQEDYSGKRVYLHIKDKYNNSIKTKLDLGVHSHFDIEQEEYCFNLNQLDGSVCLFVNSKEQVFVEKIKSLLKHGIRSTRYKDLYDFYYLIEYTNLDNKMIKDYFDLLIIKDQLVKEKSIYDIRNRINEILNNSFYKNNVIKSKTNWLDVPIEEVINSLINYIDNI